MFLLFLLISKVRGSKKELKRGK
jgi:hypothetical protein